MPRHSLNVICCFFVYAWVYYVMSIRTSQDLAFFSPQMNFIESSNEMGYSPVILFILNSISSFSVVYTNPVM